MVQKFKSHTLGKLEIFIEPATKVLHGQRSLFRQIFPKSLYLHIIADAKNEGILNASAHSTHTSFNSNGTITSFNNEGDNSKLSMCVELIDKREKLEHFFLKHRDSLRSKVVIFKEVEFWDVD